MLIEHSVYREDEVRVGGSPRLDLAGPQVDRDGDAVRAELGIAPDDRLVVLSGHMGPHLSPVPLSDRAGQPGRPAAARTSTSS